MEEQQILIFEFKDHEVSEKNRDGGGSRDMRSLADDGSTLTRIADAVANHGGSSARSRSRSRNSSSIRIGWSQADTGVRSKQPGESEFQSITSSLHTLLASFATPGAAAAFLRYSCDLMTQWLEGRAERSITFKHHKEAIVLKGRDDIAKLITRLQQQ